MMAHFENSDFTSMKSSRRKDERREALHHHRRVWYWGRIVSVFLLLCLAGFSVSRMFFGKRLPLMAQLDKVEREVKTGLIELTRTPSGKARGALDEHLDSLDDQVERVRVLGGGVDEDTLTKEERYRFKRTVGELERLCTTSAAWKDAMEDVSEDRAGEQWERVVLEVLHERTRWPLMGVVHQQSAHSAKRILQDLQRGALAGIAWPIMSCRRVFAAGDPKYDVLRRIFFPYSSCGATHPGFFSGFGLAAVLGGYLLCWLGAHFRYAVLGYLGLLYFVYLLIFLVLVLLSALGLIH